MLFYAKTLLIEL